MNIVNVVVNDACLLIDLSDIGLFDAFFQLGFQAYIAPSVLNELEGDFYEQPIRKSIENKALLLYKLAAEDQKDIEKLMKAHSSKLSELDCSCLHLAQKINATLLTCERLLAKTAKNLKVDVYGSLWVLDRLIETSIISRKTAHGKLNALMAVNSRLPKDECNIRLKQW